MNIKKAEDGFSAESAEVIGILVYESEPENVSIDPLRGEMRDFCRRNIVNEVFKGKAGTSLIMPVADKKVKSVVMCGIGKEDSSCDDRVREAMFKVVRSAAERGYSSIAVNVPGAAGKSRAAAAAEGAVL
ncbi:MAG: M17 family peptidase N-terminal domain-containing protein, partial [Synergistaceae bacterium]